MPLTSSLETLTVGIARVDSIGGTALRDAVAMGESYLGEHAARDRRALLVITDGRDNASVATGKAIAAISRESTRAPVLCRRRRCDFRERRPHRLGDDTPWSGVGD